MAHPFFWYELMTSDIEGAKAFYKAVVGWEMTAFGGAGEGYGGPPYTLLEVDNGRGIGGIMAIPDDAAAHGLRPVWVGYVHVAEIDAMVEELKAAGGTVHKAPADIPSVGRFAVVADPQGAMFNLLQPDGPDAPPLPRGTIGKIDWHELHSTDWESGCSFYAMLFGWAKTIAMDMGPMGTYQLFSMGTGEDDGGMMNSPDRPSPSWMFYVTVPEIDAAAARIMANGGKISMGPHEVPGGAWIVCGEDPQGATFALTAPKR